MHLRVFRSFWPLVCSLGYTACVTHGSGHRVQVRRELKVFYSWLDRWDEQRALRGEEGKQKTDFALDADRAFASANRTASLVEFCVLAGQAVVDHAFFEPLGSAQGFQRQDGWLKFPSDMATDVPENNIVWAKITDGG